MRVTALTESDFGFLCWRVSRRGSLSNRQRHSSQREASRSRSRLRTTHRDLLHLVSQLAVVAVAPLPGTSSRPLASIWSLTASPEAPPLSFILPSHHIPPLRPVQPPSTAPIRTRTKSTLQRLLRVQHCTPLHSLFLAFPVRSHTLTPLLRCPHS